MEGKRAPQCNSRLENALLGRWIAVYVGVEDFPLGFGPAEFAKTELAEEAMGVAGCETKADLIFSVE